MAARGAAVLLAVASAVALSMLAVSTGRARGSAPAFAPVAAPTGATVLRMGGPAGPSSLTPVERRSLDIVSMTAVGSEETGLSVTVTFAGNPERTLGRGHLKPALVALIVQPRDPSFSNAYLATRGAGALGTTLRKTQSSAVGVVRSGRSITFFIDGPGAENVGRVTVKVFASFHAPGGARTPAVSADFWDKVLEEFATDEAWVDDPARSPNAATTCSRLESWLEKVDGLLGRARERDAQMANLKQYLGTAIPDLETDLSNLNWTHAGATLIAVGSGVLVPLAALTGNGAATAKGIIAYGGALGTTIAVREAKRMLRDAIRALKQDVQLADAFLAANRRLTEKLLHLKGRIEAFRASRCVVTIGGDSTWTHNPPLGKSNVCVDITTTPAQAAFRVTLTGPGFSAHTPDPDPKLVDGKGRFIGTITRAGTFKAEIEVFNAGGDLVGSVTRTFVVADPPRDGPVATPPCPKPTE